MLERAHQADRHDRNAKLLRDPEAAFLEFVYMTIARASGFGENNEACAGIDGFLRQAPHAFQIRRAPHIRHGNVPETFHQPTVRGNFEVRF